MELACGSNERPKTFINNIFPALFAAARLQLKLNCP